MRRYGRVDSNHGEVVKALRKIGCTVQSLASVGSGCPDLLVGYRGDNFCLEVKRADGPPSGKKLTDAETAWQGDWRGSVATIYSPEEAIHYILSVGR